MSFPQNWKIQKLKDIVYSDRKITYGIVQPGENIAPNGIPLIRGKDYSSGKINLYNLYHVTPEIDKPYQRSKVKENDILLTIVGYVGQTAIVPKELENANITQTTARISVNHDVANYQFVDFFLNSYTGQKNLKKYEKGSAQAGLNLKDIEKVDIFLPPLQEQNKIADILSTVDQKIDLTDTQIEETKALKKGLMQKLLTEGIGHTEFKDSEIGQIPITWEIVKMGDLCKLTAGGTPSTKEKTYWEPKEVPWLSSGEVNKKKVFFTDNMISETGLNNSSAKLLPKHSILVALAGQGKTRGTVAITEIELTTNQSVAAILPCNEIIPFFLYHNLNSRYQELRGMSTGVGGRGGLNLAILKSVNVGLPPLEEQQQIADILSKTDEKLEVLRTKRELFEVLKKGLMQNLLTGKVRVK